MNGIYIDYSLPLHTKNKGGGWRQVLKNNKITNGHKKGYPYRIFRNL